jgi:hypothetical protein
MAQVTFQHLVSGALGPGATHSWTWNNASEERVRAFSVDAEVPPLTGFPGATAKVEITRVEYRQNFNGPGDTEQEIRFWVKNTGTMAANYYVHMATIRE